MDSLEAVKSSALTNENASLHFHCALILSTIKRLENLIWYQTLLNLTVVIRLSFIETLYLFRLDTATLL